VLGVFGWLISRIKVRALAADGHHEAAAVDELADEAPSDLENASRFKLSKPDADGLAAKARAGRAPGAPEGPAG